MSGKPLLPKWIYPIRVRFLAVHVLLLAVPVAGVGFARFYEREMLASLEQDMINQGTIVAELVRSDPSGPRLAEREGLLRKVARTTRTRIRLLDEKGELAADSHSEGPPEGVERAPPQLLPATTFSRGGTDALSNARLSPMAIVDSLPWRREVQDALSGRYASHTRLYTHGDRLFLFSALPIKSVEGTVLGVVYVTRSTNPVRASMYRIRSSLLTIFGVAFAITLIISLFLAATISRPLARLTGAATAIAQGDRNRSLQVDRHDEIGQLATAFAAMTTRLDARARETAELAANISHEFKSPLTSLRGAAELLLEGAADDPAARERFLRNMLADAARLDRLVSRLLELSRVEADAAPAEVIDYRALVEELAQRHGAKVALHWTSSARELRGRRANLVAAVGNLVDNALQHASPGSVVTVRVIDAAGRRIRTEVHNEGAVISPANLARVWDRFFTTRADRGGSGLGLPIVLAVARGHGGTVDVESSAQSGTTFAIELPS